MSLVAASFTKSAVVGATPRTEFTPVFSPIDWANAGDDSRTSARTEATYFIVGILFEFRMSHHTHWQCSGSFQSELFCRRRAVARYWVRPRQGQGVLLSAFANNSSEGLRDER